MALILVATASLLIGAFAVMGDCEPAVTCKEGASGQDAIEEFLTLNHPPPVPFAPAEIPHAGQTQEVLDASRFEEVVVGKDLRNVENGVTATVTADGSIAGMTADRSSRVVGRWSYEGGYFCENVRVGSRSLPGDCLEVTLDGDKVIFTRERGAGQTSTWEFR